MKNENLKPFNLEAALQGKPVVTRDGRPVKIAGYNPDANEEMTIVGWINGCPESWSSDGRYRISKIDSNTDLFMLAETVTLWVNVYEVDGSIETGTLTYDTEEEAIKRHSKKQDKYFGAYPLTFKR